jgi:hypothetical protein
MASDGSEGRDKRVLVALRLREAIVEAALWKDAGKLASLSTSLVRAKLPPHAVSLSGLPLLLQDTSLWPLAVRDDVAKLLAHWRAEHSALRTERPHEAEAARAKRLALEVARPFRGKLCSDLIVAVDELEEALRAVDGAQAASRSFRALAARLATRGFYRLTMLDGLLESEVTELGSSPWERALLGRAQAQVRTEAEVKRMRAVQAASAPSAAPPRSAKSLSVSVRHIDTRKLWAELESGLELDRPLGSMRPAEAIRVLSLRSQSGLDVSKDLDSAVSALAFQQIFHSRASVASGLSAWAAFAEGVLQYQESETLPPRTTVDAQRFVTIFRNGATAYNYLLYVLWSCKLYHLDTLWWSAELRLTLSGSKKRSRDLLDLQPMSPLLTLLDTSIVQRLVTANDAAGQVWLSVFVLVCWFCLLRVASEGIALEKGNAEDVTSLPSHRHSGVWVDRRGVAHLRLRRRKHRQQGALISRPCTCSSGGVQFCLPHRLGPFLEGLAEGQRLWQVSAHAAHRMLQSQLTFVVGRERALRFTLKAFRAGHATELSRKGCSVQEVLAAGDWKGSTLFSYVRPDEVNDLALLTTAFDRSDEES